MSDSKSSLTGQVHPVPRTRHRSATVTYPAALLAASTVCGPAALTFAHHRCGALLIMLATMANSVITAATILASKLGPDWLRLRATREFTRDQRWDNQHVPTTDEACRLAQQRADLLKSLLANASERSTRTK